MKRLQRLRFSKNLRDLCAETEFTTSQLIQPLFVVESLSRDEPVTGMLEVFRHSEKGLLDQVSKDYDRGVKNFMLFVVPQKKASSQFDWNFASRVIEKVKAEMKDNITLWVDTCLCSSTESGHCCIFDKNGLQNLDQSLIEISKAALSFARAGADGIAPSDMNDGRVRKIRDVLDEVQGGVFRHLPLMSYSTKFASQFYGPFREAADSAPQFGDRAQYQIDVRHRTDAMAASLRCAEEGADLLMVKPGLTSLDLIAPIAEATKLQVGAYQVSGEFAGLTLLAEKKLLQFDKALLETWHVFKRARAQFIITYGARRAQKLGVKVS